MKFRFLPKNPIGLAKVMFFSIFILILLATIPFAISNFIFSKEKIVELNTAKLHSIALTYSEVFNGDSVEQDFIRKKKNSDYDNWKDIADSTLKKNNMKYLYVMNVNYNDSIEYYISAKDNEGQINFLEKEETREFDTIMIKDIKKNGEGAACSISFTRKYGWLVSCIAPIKNSKGEVVAFVGVDKEISDITYSLKQTSARFFLISLLFVIVLLLMITYVIIKLFINPIQKIIHAADNFNLLNKSFKNLDYTYIREYNSLIKSFKKMEQKITFALEKSFTDDLTKLNNRYFFTLSMENILKPSEQEKNLSFFVIDIDHFKQINDTYGHEKGDFVLKCIGTILRDLFNDSQSIVIRLGGDEFAVCMEKNIDMQFIENKCKELKERLTKIVYSKDSNKVTASVGAVTCKFSKSPPPYSKIFSTADSALYKVKASGRNGYAITNLASQL